MFHLGILTASFRNQSHQELKLQYLDSWNLDTLMSVEFAVTLTLVSVTEFHWKFYCVQKVQHNTSPNCLFGVVRSSWRSSAPRHHKQPTLIWVTKATVNKSWSYKQENTQITKINKNVFLLLILSYLKSFENITHQHEAVLFQLFPTKSFHTTLPESVTAS